MDLNNNIKRRAVATKRRSYKDRIPATGQTTYGVPNRELYPAGVGQDTAECNNPKHKRQQQRQQFSKSNKKQSQIDRYLRHDREMIVFLFLAILGAAVVVIAYFTFSIAFEKGDKSGTAFGRVVERLPFLSDILNNDRYIKNHEITHSATNRFGPQHAEFQETMPTYFVETEGGMHLKRPRLDGTIIKNVNTRDFGGLDLDFRESEKMGTTRQIRYDSMRMQSYFRDYRTVGRDDDQDNYYAYDDDYLRDPFTQSYPDDDEVVEVDGHRCRRISEHRLYFPNCNSFHETPLLESGATHIGAGSYRQAMRIEISFAQEKETVVVKDIHLSNNLAYDAYEFTRMDAIVAERLTASSRIYAIYGTCGIGIMSEYFPHGNIEEIAIPDDDIIFHMGEEDRPLICYNELPGLMKLKISLHMAEALADLHGYSGGVIVHQDMKLDQFFLNANMSEVVLNDFNRAEFLLWDERNGKYCGQRQGYGMGNWRSPEEYYDEFLNEKVDVYSLGNNMYSLLTGLMVFHQVFDYREVQHLVAEGEKPYIDSRYKERSLAEAKLVEIIEKCHEYFEINRPSIFEVVDFLSEALEEVHDAMNEDR